MCNRENVTSNARLDTFRTYKCENNVERGKINKYALAVVYTAMKVKQQALNNMHENTINELESLQPALGKTNSEKTTPACHNTAQTRSCREIVANQM